jgi:hypothetical protein
MSDSDSHDNDDKTITPADMRQWLGREIAHVMKEAELRVRDATEFVTAYASGEIAEKELSERMNRYDARWGETTLQAAMAGEQMGDEEILRRLDAERTVTNSDWSERLKKTRLGPSRLA